MSYVFVIRKKAMNKAEIFDDNLQELALFAEVPKKPVQHFWERLNIGCTLASLILPMRLGQKNLLGVNSAVCGMRSGKSFGNY